MSFRRRQERRESKYGHLLIPDDFPEAQRLPECRLRLEIPDSDYDGIERPLSGKLGKDVRYLVFLSCALDGFTCNRLQTANPSLISFGEKNQGKIEPRKGTILPYSINSMAMLFGFLWSEMLRRVGWWSDTSHSAQPVSMPSWV